MKRHATPDPPPQAVVHVLSSPVDSSTPMVRALTPFTSQYARIVFRCTLSPKAHNPNLFSPRPLYTSQAFPSRAIPAVERAESFPGVDSAPYQVRFDDCTPQTV